MAQENPNRLAEWVVVLRTQWPELRRRLTVWWKACQEEPRLIWQTNAIRYGAYGLGGLIVVWCVAAVAEAMAPAQPAAQPEAVQADFHVICEDFRCGQHYMIQRKFGFKKFPVECGKCGRRTGEQALRCSSQECGGVWVVPQIDQGWRSCPNCGGSL